MTLLRSGFHAFENILHNVRLFIKLIRIYSVHLLNLSLTFEYYFALGVFMWKIWFDYCIEFKDFAVNFINVLRP